MPPSEPPYMEKLRALIRGDGLDFEYLGVDPMQGVLKLRLFASGRVCASCVTTREWWEELALGTVRKVNPAIRKVAIDDQR